MLALGQPRPCGAQCNTSTHRLTHSQEPRDKHIAIRLPLDAACTRLNKKNTVAGRTTVVTTLAFPTSAVTCIEPRTHYFGNSRTSRSQTTGLDVPTACTTKRCVYHIVMTMVRSQLGGTNPHAPARDVEYTCASTRIVFLLPRFSQVAKTGGNHGGSAKEIPMQMNILTMTHIKSRAD